MLSASQIPSEIAWKALRFYDWGAKARPNQREPQGDWSGWLLLAGRGFGKTRTGAEWVRAKAEGDPKARIALIAPTAADARDVMVEGESGLLAIAPPWNRPLYEPSKRRVTWPNGAQAAMYSAEEADRLRGPQHTHAWADELAAWKNPQEVWDMLQFGLRLGDRPRWVATTTPRPIPLVKELLRRDDVVISRGSTFDNLANLAPQFIEAIRERYAGTRLGRQEIEAEILDDVPGALWTRAYIDEHRRKEAPQLQRVVVAVDPSGSNGNDEDADEIGIVIAGKGIDGRAYILGDYSCSLSPDGWGRRVAEAYRTFRADRVVGEKNFGGDMVRFVIQTADSRIAYKDVTASRGKAVRAEPVAALYEQGKVSHVGSMPELEDQMCSFTTTGYLGSGSPDRVDALVWALTELMVTGSGYTLANLG